MGGLIPEDVRAAAYKAMENVDSLGALGVISRAILAERQRCAEVVKGAFLLDPRDNTNAINCYDAILAPVTL